MLAAALHHWLTPAPGWTTEMGYLREQVALDFRHRRQRAAWAPHLEHCHDLIRTAAEAAPDKGRCRVLGSGHALDIPLDDLSAIFTHVDLVDLVHPRALRRRAKKFPNVALVTADISGVARAAYELSAPPLPAPKHDAAILADAGFVVSANVLSQLPLVPLDWLERRCPWADAAARQAFARAVIDRHLTALQHHEGQVCLIAEIMRFVHDGGRAIRKVDPLFGAPIMLEGEEWWWDIAPRPEFSPDFDVRLRILGIPDLGQAPHARYCRNTTLAAP